MCPNMEKCHAVRLGCVDILLTSSLWTNWCSLIPSNVLKHHWSRASVLHYPVITQHSDPYRKIGRIQVLYSFSIVEIEMCDFQKWLSRLCIVARVIPLRRMMSGVLCVDEWMREPRYTNSSTNATCWPWTEMVGGTFTLVLKDWTFLFCRLTSNPRKVASLAPDVDIRLQLNFMVFAKCCHITGKAMMPAVILKQATACRTWWKEEFQISVPGT